MWTFLKFELGFPAARRIRGRDAFLKTPHAGYYWLLAEVRLTRPLCAGMLRRIAALTLPGGIRQVQGGAGFDDGPGRRKSMTALGARRSARGNRSEKAFPGVMCLPDAKPAYSGPAGNTVDQSLNFAKEGLLALPEKTNRFITRPSCHSHQTVGSRCELRPGAYSSTLLHWVLVTEWKYSAKMTPPD